MPCGVIGGPEGKGLRKANDGREGRIELNKEEIERAVISIKLAISGNARRLGSIKFSEDLREDSWYALLKAIKVPSNNTNGMFAAVWGSEVS